MAEQHLKQPECTYSACGQSTKHRERIQKFRDTGDLKHLYRNELDQIQDLTQCFQLKRNNQH